MYIEEVVLEGFKSYAQRVVLRDFDKHFNAITGFNGSGKSNIFDAICFVLGISTWSHVRVSNIDGLIYKSGQTQICKATVSIVFNNSDKSKSPIGYETCNKITVTRQIMNSKSKYMINGRSANPQKVTNLFGSVQLDIDNPHFLVMQGKITKILLMKPIEILRMIQEASGTGVYERKKIKCQSKIQMKEKKVEEIQNILDNSIKPAMLRAKENKLKHNRIESLRTKTDTLKKQLKLIQYANEKALIQSSIRERDAIKLSLEECSKSLETIEAETSTVLRKIEEGKARRGVDAVLKSLEENIKHISMKLIGTQSDFNHSKENLEEEMKLIDDVKTELKNKVDEIARLKRSFEGLKLQLGGKKDLVEQWKNRASNLERALNGTGSVNSNSTSELIRCNENIAEANAQIRMCQSNIKEIENDIQMTQSKAKRSKGLFEECQNKVHIQERELTSLQESLGRLDFSIETFNDKEQKKGQLEEKLKQFQNQIDETARQSDILRIVQEWEKRLSPKILGPLIGLFQTKHEKYNLAISACVGGRLSNIVIDSDETGSKLVEEATRTKKRLTFLPMNKIRSNPINAKAKELAEEYGAKLALDVIEYDRTPGMDKIMQFIFGTFFVCETMEIAQRVFNDKRIGITAVSLDGSVLRPGGTLSGGYHDTKNDFIASVQKYNSLRHKYAIMNKELQDLSAILSSMREQSDKYNDLKKNIELKTQLLEMQQNTLRELDYQTILKKIEQLKGKLDVERQKLETYKEKEKRNQERATQLQAEIKIFEKGVVDKRKTQAELNEAESKYKSFKKEFERISEEIDMLDAQCEESAKEEVSLKEKIMEKESNLQIIRKKHDDLSIKLAKRQAEYDRQQSLIKKRSEEIKETENELMTLNERRDELRKEKSNKEADVKSMKNRLKHVIEQINKSEANVEAMLKENKDLDSELHQVEGCNEVELKNELDTLEAEMTELGETVSELSLHEYEDNKKKFKELNMKKEKILSDRGKIEGYINDWDDKMNNALLTTFEKVNQDFSMIFSDLLPHATAKLEPVNPSNINDGVEFKVAFGGVWKESLIELSGGQKSLLGLSLILAFLRCKPAPLYILDEIDAALDPSHTQNIGQMLKRRFTGSQFIIISLKQGMFQNANVIFRTKLQNGQSSVERTVPTSSTVHALANELATDDKENRLAAMQEVEVTTSSKKRKREEANEPNPEFLLS